MNGMKNFIDLISGVIAVLLLNLFGLVIQCVLNFDGMHHRSNTLLHWT